ncbi:nucleoside deaminase [Metapseudomonas boanensis]|uniref:Nucleoside deaminase n=1 Tax=Metapseudomonas boanensis TaxID=2822138 RepID=A0ABS5XPZ4_9GAMM|nr:nucleoside deaminase [Pseudomonas boanensis]MBT8769175.1 nucleoside deaminase [Pseudomonas boanensis]
MSLENNFLEQAVELARQNVENGGRPFGALLVRDGQVLARAVNEMHLDQDPTAHAELQAIRAASQQLGPRLDGCVIYASGQPCPMCLAAMHLCGVERVVFAAANAEGEPFGLSTAAIYQQMALPLGEQKLDIQHLPQPAMAVVYARWKSLHDPH